MQLVIDIAATPHPYLSPNRSSRLPKMAHAREAQKARTRARIETEKLQSHEWWPTWSRWVHLNQEFRLEWMVAWEKGHKRVDEDNLIAMLKPYQDGVADALGINDRAFIPTIHSQLRDPAGTGWMRLVITPL